MIEGSSYISFQAFFGCLNLTAVTLNGGNLNSKAFANCPELTDVYCNSETPPTVNATNVFEDSHIENAILHVPSNALNVYAANDFWEQQGYSLRSNLNYRNKSLNDQIPAGE